MFNWLISSKTTSKETREKKDIVSHNQKNENDENDENKSSDTESTESGESIEILDSGVDNVNNAEYLIPSPPQNNFEVARRIKNTRYNPFYQYHPDDLPNEIIRGYNQREERISKEDKLCLICQKKFALSTK